jgi:REP element-mobilizing transposase RayT
MNHIEENNQLLFKNKYRIPSARLINWDYSSNGFYFITINSKYAKHYFGKIINKKMELNEIGKIAEKYWWEIPNHFKNVKLDEFIIMPNHIHGIISICRDDGNASSLNQLVIQKGDKAVPCLCDKKVSISSIIGSYKSICTREINKFYPEIYFKWHSRFYDRIIRNEKELNNVRNYIIKNPSKYNPM